MCPYCAQAKQTRGSISGAATGGFIKSGNLKPGDKVYCDHCMSIEPGFVANNHRCVLKHEKSSCATIMVEHA